MASSCSEMHHNQEMETACKYLFGCLLVFGGAQLFHSITQEGHLVSIKAIKLGHDVASSDGDVENESPSFCLFNCKPLLFLSLKLIFLLNAVLLIKSSWVEETCSRQSDALVQC